MSKVFIEKLKKCGFSFFFENQLNVASGSLNAVSEWNIANPSLEDNVPNQRRGNTQWEPPAQDYLKCNFDSSYGQGPEFMGVGWILRNSNGVFIEAGWAKSPQVGSPLQAEACGFLYVIQRIWSRGQRQVWFEGDNLELTNLVNKEKESMDLGNLLCDTCFWINKLPLCSLDHVNRERNHIADLIA